MEAALIFVLLPVALIVLALRIRPVVKRDDGPHDALGGGLAAGGMFGGHGLDPDPVSVREDTEAVRFDLDAVRSPEAAGPPEAVKPRK